jgi:hypothetical protein
MIKTANNLTKNGRGIGYFLFFLSLVTAIGGIVYYLYALNWLGIIITLALSIAILIRFRTRLPKRDIQNDYLISNKKGYWLLAAYGLFFVTAVISLWSGRSGRPLISPWDVVSPGFFWLYAFASLALLIICLSKTLGAGWKILGLSFHYLLSAGVAVIVYRIGYGFDPFVHRATMELIASQGAVLPKPPYYLGEYSLIVIFHKLSGLSLDWLNRLLVPGLAAIFLPTAFYHFLKNASRTVEASQRTIWLTIFFLPILTFSPFIMTTPQNLSYLFLILAILYTFPADRLVLPTTLALAATVTHPLTGLPALGWITLLAFNRYRDRLEIRVQKIVRRLIFAFIALALPLALFIAGGANWRGLSENRESFWEPLKNFFGSVGLSGREDWLLNFLYFIAHNYSLLLLAAIAAAISYFLKRSAEPPAAYRRFGYDLLKASGALIIALLLSYRLSFNDLISYEQSGYANRILVIIIIFLLPLVVVGLQSFINRIRRQDYFVKAAWAIFGLVLLSAALYLSYPRFDKYWNSRGYSTSSYDLKAVSLIDQLAKGPYIVLANQQVSAAALMTFGFNHYYQTPSGSLYFYPIPTGGPLYQDYLDMVYKNPDRQTMLRALDRVGVDEGFLIVNKYWYQSGQVINQAKLTADSWRDIDGEVYIFGYRR